MNDARGARGALRPSSCFDLARGCFVFLVNQWNLRVAAGSHYAL